MTDWTVQSVIFCLNTVRKLPEMSETAQGRKKPNKVKSVNEGV